MSNYNQSRRAFLHKGVGVAVAGTLTPYWLTAQCTVAKEVPSKNDLLHVGAIGVNGRGTTIAGYVGRFGEVVAVCDVYRPHAERANEKVCHGKAAIYNDYRKLLERKDIDAVTIGTPEHWHAKIAIDAMNAGKDVYCEKPLTLTIEEGKLLCEVVRRTNRVLQVGTQQRSGEYGGQFPTAVAMVRAGRIGRVRRVTVGIGPSPSGGPFRIMAPPAHLDWDRWLGQAPRVEYCQQRFGEHHSWYEYAGGEITNWGTHHVDIAQWAIGMEHSGPVTIEGTATHPNIPNGYNTATAFHVTCRFPNGVELVIRHDADGGILFEGEKGRFFVNRGKITGKPAEQLREDPLPEEAITKLYKGKRPGEFPKVGIHRPGNHMANFFAAIQDRRQPVSDAFTHHRILTTCHLANICIRLGRKLTWDPQKEQIVGDEEANAWQSRRQRKGYEITA